MSDLMADIGKLGLDELERCDYFAGEIAGESVMGAAGAAKKIAGAVKDEAAQAKDMREAELIYDKEFTCPVCSHKFKAKIMKAGRARQIGADSDLRPRFENIDSLKYDVLLCNKCGYAAMEKFFLQPLPAQIKLVKEYICSKVKVNTYNDIVYSYEQALERYKLALANAVVKKSKSSERAYICLKTGWLLRGQREEIEATEGISEKTKTLAKIEIEYLGSAYNGFLNARTKELPPFAGMDANTLEYLLAQLSYRLGKYDESLRFISQLLLSPVNERVKNKARELKEQVFSAKKAVEEICY